MLGDPIFAQPRGTWVRTTGTQGAGTLFYGDNTNSLQNTGSERLKRSEIPISY